MLRRYDELFDWWPSKPPAAADASQPRLSLWEAANKPVFDLSKPFGTVGLGLGTVAASTLKAASYVFPDFDPLAARRGKWALKANEALQRYAVEAQEFGKEAGERTGALLSPTPLTYMTAGLFNAGPIIGRLTGIGFTVANATGALRSYLKALEDTPRHAGEGKVDYAERLLMHPEMQSAATQTAFSLLGLAGDRAQASARKTQLIEDSLTRAIKPASSRQQWSDNVRRAIPDLAAAARERMNVSPAEHGFSPDNQGPVTNFDGLLNTILRAKNKVWAEVQQLEAPSKDLTIDGNSVADSMEGVITKRFEEQHPDIAARIRKLAAGYRRAIPVSEVEERIQGANNDLFPYYSKGKVGQDVARADPATGYVVREAEALRKAADDKMHSFTGEHLASVKKRYGALKTLERETLNRKNVAARLQPQSVAEQISKARAIGRMALGAVTGSPSRVAEGVLQYGAAKYYKYQNLTDTQITNAFQAIIKQAGPKRVTYRGPAFPQPKPPQSFQSPPGQRGVGPANADLPGPWSPEPAAKAIPPVPVPSGQQAPGPSSRSSPGWSPEPAQAVPPQPARPGQRGPGGGPYYSMQRSRAVIAPPGFTPAEVAELNRRLRGTTEMLTPPSAPPAAPAATQAGAGEMPRLPKPSATPTAVDPLISEHRYVRNAIKRNVLASSQLPALEKVAKASARASGGSLGDIHIVEALQYASAGQGDAVAGLHQVANSAQNPLHVRQRAYEVLRAMGRE